MDLDYIFRRRSIRKFNDEPLSDLQIKSILEAAMAAPSAHNNKPWHFIVIRERKTLDRIAEVHPYGKMLFQAPLAVAVCGDTAVSSKRWDQDCAAATENILLALPELGLGGVWLGYYPRSNDEDFLKDIISVPENIKVFSMVAIGHPDEEKIPRSQYEDIKIHFEQW
ncbi:nitroreductase family protein [bacterium]|nr:nitroreductase family protein [bacterium]MBU1064965.1 nitroreductase family protein [bacterium]MBU1635011.1 nitroreductase family protein [bacterium]MBU1872733.1 nitroreductase family protein [bacterium]